MSNIKEKETFERWEELPLTPDLLRGIYTAGFESPSFIQKTTILPMLQKRDIRAQAQSGTGKTGAFCVGVLQIACDGGRAIVLASTREIARQNYETLRTLGKFMQIETCLLMGGTSVREDISNLERLPQVIVGTPGRVKMLMESQRLNSKAYSLLIIDEADEMLKKGFKDQVNFIYNQMSISQVCMFSATWESDEIEISNKILQNPFVIDLRNEEQTLKGIEQYYILMDDSKHQRKISTIMDLYYRCNFDQCIVFCNTLKRVKEIYESLTELKFQCGVMYSDLDMDERNRTIESFKKGETKVLIASNLIGRGVDVQSLKVVINYEIPVDNATYIHRIGRAGRYGRKGIAINLLFEGEMNRMKEIEEFYRTKVNEFEVEE